MKYWLKQGRGLRLLTALDIIRTNPSKCDFEVRFNGQSFRAHRAVLMTSSDYFRGMLQSNMKESAQGFVELKGLNMAAVKDCLEYLYTGEIEMEFETVDSVLQACVFLQIDEVREICFQYLNEIVSPEKCLQILYYATRYRCLVTIDATVQYIMENYNAFVESDEYQKAEKVIVIELLRSVLNYSTQCLWHGITRWVAYTPEREADILDFLREIPKLCVKSTLEFILDHPLVVKNADVMKYIVTKVFFTQWVKFREHISDGNCLKAYRWTKDYQCDLKSVFFASVVMEYMKVNFSTVYQLKDFAIITKKDLEMLLVSVETASLCQTIKWRAIIKWVEFDVAREAHFLSLLKFVNLEYLSGDFINTTIRNYPLIQSSNELKEQVMNAVIYHKEKVQPVNAYLLFDKTTGAVHRYYKDSWNLLITNEKFIDGILLEDGGNVYLLNFPNLYKIRKDGCIEVKQSSPNSDVVKTSVVHRGKIFVFHDELKHSIYELTQGEWRISFHGFNIPDGVAACSTEKGILFVGGNTKEKFIKFHDPELKLSAASSSALPDAKDGPTQSIKPMQYKRYNASCASVGNTVLLVGGQNSNNHCHGNVIPSETYNIKSNTWSVFNGKLNSFGNKHNSCCKANGGFLIGCQSHTGIFGGHVERGLQMGYFSNWTSFTIENVPQVTEMQLAGLYWEEKAVQKQRGPLFPFVGDGQKTCAVGLRVFKTAYRRTSK